jgi:hypothetical protein
LTKLLILGRAKVIGYNKLKEAQEKRAKVEAAKKAQGKGKCGQKCISTVPEADVAEPKPKTARVSKALKLVTSLIAQISRSPVAEGRTVSEP